MPKFYGARHPMGEVFSEMFRAGALDGGASAGLHSRWRIDTIESEKRPWR